LQGVRPTIFLGTNPSKDFLHKPVDFGHHLPFPLGDQMFTLQFTIPGPPVGKGRPRFSTQGGKPRSYTPAVTREYEALIAARAAEAMAGRDPLKTPLTVYIHAFMSVPLSWSKAKRQAALDGPSYPPRPDVDNIAKTVLDGMNGVVYADDAQVTYLKVTKRYAEEGSVTVWLSENIW
jgi:Holliday junction resolvase RusA-like endonuclease